MSPVRHYVQTHNTEVMGYECGERDGEGVKGLCSQHGQREARALAIIAAARASAD